VVLVRDLDIQEAFPLSEPQRNPPPLDGTNYREIAWALRKLAHQCRPASACRELLQLAARLERRAEHLTCIHRREIYLADTSKRLQRLPADSSQWTAALRREINLQPDKRPDEIARAFVKKFEIPRALQKYFTLVGLTGWVLVLRKPRFMDVKTTKH
jgi:hypothetical protein